RRAGVLKVILKSCALEILHGIELARPLIDLAELFRDREAKGREAATALPEAAEGSTKRMAALRIERALAAGVSCNPLKSRLTAAFGEMPAQQRQRNIELGWQLGVQLEARTLEVLH